MTPEDREFIVRALAVHAAIGALADVGATMPEEKMGEFIQQFAKAIREYANAQPPPKPEEPKTVRLVDGRELPIRDRRAS